MRGMSRVVDGLKKHVKRALHGSFRLGVSMAIAVIIGSIIILLYGHNPMEIYGMLIQGAFGSRRSLFITLQRATPLIFTALASALAFRTGVFNVGIESQFYIGALCGTVVGYAFDLPAIIHLPLTFLAAFVGGALWAVVPAILRERLKISEIVTTIMTNYVAFQLRDYLLIYVLRVGPHLAETPFVKDSVKLPQFTELVPGLGRGSQAHVGIFLAFATAIVLYAVLKYTRRGYEWRMVGVSFPFSEFAGMNMKRAFMTGFVASGGIAAIGGLVEILGVWRRYKQLFGVGFGFKGNLAALLGGRTVVGSTAAALFYGSMEAGSVALEWNSGVPRQLIDILIGLIIFFMAAPGLWDFLKSAKLISGPITARRAPAGREA